MTVPVALSATTRHRPILLALVLLTALLLRAALFAGAYHNNPDLHTLHTDDTATYIIPAETLLADGTFSCHGVPEIYRTPGYPLLLTAGLLVGHLELVTFAIQMVLCLATIALAYHLAWKLTASTTAALVASALVAWEPLSITFTSYVMPETLFTFLLLAALSLLLHYLRTSSAPALGGAALMLAAATFVRPISYYLPLLLVSLLALRALIGHSATGNSATASTEPARTDRRGRVLGFLAAVGFGVLAIAPCAAWQVRNYLTTGYSKFSGIPECNLYFWQGASILAQQSGKTLRQVQIDLGQNDEQLVALLHGPKQAATIRRLGAEGRRLVLEHPFEYAKIHARGTLILALDPGPADLLRAVGLYPEGLHGLRPLNISVGETLSRMRREVPQVLYLSLALGAILALVYCATALGLLAALRRVSWQWTVMVGTLAYLFAVSGGPTGYARSRQPMMPMICILASYGIATLLSYAWRKRQSAPGQLHSATSEIQRSRAA